jgi:hypothetical protein
LTAITSEMFWQQALWRVTLVLVSVGNRTSDTNVIETHHHTFASRVDAQSVARLLPSVIVAWNGRPTPPLAIAALIAAASALKPDLPGSRYSGVVETAVGVFGRDYAEGFVDGFNCVEAKRGHGLRYVEGLDDAQAARALLRKLPWGQMLLANALG